MTERGGPPEGLGAAIERFLREHGHKERVIQSAVLDDWRDAVGAQIARITEATGITPDGTLIVTVTTNAWMSELSLHEPEFIARLNTGFERPRVRRIRWQLRGRPAPP